MQLISDCQEYDAESKTDQERLKEMVSSPV